MTLLKHMRLRKASLICGILALAVACACSKNTNVVKQKLFDAINANDFARVKQLLPPDGFRDLDAATYKAAIDVACDRFAEALGTPLAHRRLEMIEELTTHYRRLIGKPINVAGTLSPGLVDHGGGNFTSGLLTLKTSNGTSYPVAISTDETKYAGDTFDGRMFLVNFDAIYKIGGVLVGDVIQAENVESSRGPSGKGMVIPVSLLLPSTEELVDPHIDAYQAKQKLTKDTTDKSAH